MNMKQCFSMTDREFELYQIGAIHCSDRRAYSEAISKFLNQPERSKREDSCKRSLTESQYDQFMRETDEYMRCGALNTGENQ